jgi:F-box/leucine-rich repeat protein 10/11
VDPVKAAEAPVPRGSASKKRRISDEHDGEAINKKLKRESFAGLVDGEISQWNRYPLSKPRAASATEARNSIAMQSAQEALNAMDHTPSEFALIDPQFTNGDNDMIRVATPHQTMAADTVISSIEEDHEGEPMDDVIESEPTDAQIDPQLLAEPRTPAPTNTRHNGQNGVKPNSSHETSSVSPGQGPPIAQPSATTPTMARPPSSRVSATPRKPSQTPHHFNRNSTTPRKTPGSKGRRESINLGTIKVEPGSGSKPRAMSSTEGTEEDVASLQLALQLQMEEHGLRRRSK